MAMIVIGIIGIVFLMLMSWTLNFFVSSLFAVSAIVLAFYFLMDGFAGIALSAAGIKSVAQWQLFFNHPCYKWG